MRFEVVSLQRLVWPLPWQGMATRSGARASEVESVELCGGGEALGADPGLGPPGPWP